VVRNEKLVAENRRWRAKNKALRVENQRLSVTMKELLMHWETFDDMGSECFFCKSHADGRGQILHARDCAWAAALAALEGKS
jgi:hypothetical protein